MFITKMLIESECGLALASKHMAEPIVIPYLYPVRKERNYVFCFTKKSKDKPFKSEILGDFETHKITSSGKYAIIDGVKKAHGIISPIQNNAGIPLFPLIISDGREQISFLTYDKATSVEITESIGNRNVVEIIESRKITVEDLVRKVQSGLMPSFTLGLTTMERDILQNAYVSGFYSWPRKYDLENLSADFNLSKPTIAYHMRNAERKLLDTIFNNSS